MDQAGHKEIMSTEPGYAKPPSQQMGTILLCQVTTKETAHIGLFSIKRMFRLRSWIWRSCSRLEFKVGVNLDSLEIWGKQLSVMNTRRAQRLVVYTEKDQYSACETTGVTMAN